MRVAHIGSIKDDILNMEELSLTLIDFLPGKIFWCIGETLSDPGGRHSCADIRSNRAFQRMSEEGGGAGLCQGLSDSVR